MDGSGPAAAAIIERVIPYLGKRAIDTCKTLNRTWYMLATIQSARDIDCHILQLPLRIAHYRRKGLLGSARCLTVDVSFVEGFLSSTMYKQRILDAAALLKSLSMPIRRLKVHAPGSYSALSDSEIHYGALALDSLARALPGLTSLDLGDCPVGLLALPNSVRFLELQRLRQIRWFSLGRNDMSSAAALRHLISCSLHTLVMLDGKGDITDQTIRMLCDAPNFQRLDASGSNISDNALLALIRSRGSQLQELVLSDCNRLTEQSIAQLTPTLLPKLMCLDLYNVMVTTDTYQCLFNMQAFWPYLRDLKLKAAIPHASPRQDSMVNDDILEAIAENCPRLVSLRLFGCHGITDHGLSAVLGNLGYLRELVVMHHSTDSATLSRDNGTVSGRPHMLEEPLSNNNSHIATTSGFSSQPNGLQQSLPSVNDIWASIPSLPTNALPQHHHALQSPPTSMPSSPCPTSYSNRGSGSQRMFTSHALSNGVRSQHFNLLNLDMAYDSACAEHLAKLSHLHVLCGRMITHHAKLLIESQFPKCKMMVWNIN
ncbi:RNI-like protein [Coemansia reversa NRRL 1564]|uniref:RNI-like protein n=1 Tax=Coemansia reversa (strain ATCC 12441 / NRRL 1564) TaxID=763665 RepID=A0A2G5B9D3_COERN|nr:RNI-like protein [Coemansia reversa NRRL 1564]|eukprot:PIA15629.1 RNI-like protein [Coemansia reversa NRRL 1564]